MAERDKGGRAHKGAAVWCSGTLALAACAGPPPPTYEQAVRDLEPGYCYRSLAAVTCYAVPFDRDSRRLTNFTGPAPETYPVSPPPPRPLPGPPSAAMFYVLDPEPIPLGQIHPAKPLAPPEAPSAPD